MLLHYPPSAGLTGRSTADSSALLRPSASADPTTLPCSAPALPGVPWRLISSWSIAPRRKLEDSSLDAATVLTPPILTASMYQSRLFGRKSRLTMVYLFPKGLLFLSFIGALLVIHVLFHKISRESWLCSLIIGGSESVRARPMAGHGHVDGCTTRLH
jgi:hypothetical protein